MKNIYICLTFLFFGLGWINELDAQYLIVKFQDGTEETSEISLLQNLSFPDNLLKVNYYSGLTDSYELSSVRTIYFQSFTTGTEDYTLDNNQEVSVHPNPATDKIYIKNAPEAAFTVAIYRIDGALIFQQQIYSSNQSIDISSLTNGLYLLRIDNQALKFIKQ